MSKIDNILATVILGVGAVTMLGAAYGVVRINIDHAKNQKKYEETMAKSLEIKNTILNMPKNKKEEAK
jgi:hypothetical protein